MLTKLYRAVIDAAGHRPPGRAVEVAPDDVFLVSYPKSGNTWVRFMLASLLEPEREIDFTSVREVIPGIYHASARRLASLARPRLLKSHEYFDPRYPKVIYLVRDPRDVCISYFHHRHRQPGKEGTTLEEHVRAFLKGELDRYGRWEENVGSWIGAKRSAAEMLIVRYEDLKADPIRELERIRDFLGLAADDAAIEASVRRSSFDEMQRLERFQAEVTGSVSAVRIARPFVRAGRTGGWADELPAACAAMIEEQCEWPMAVLGYEPGAPWPGLASLGGQVNLSLVRGR